MRKKIGNGIRNENSMETLKNNMYALKVKRGKNKIRATVQDV